MAFNSPQADIPMGLPAMTAERAFQLAQAAFDLAANAGVGEAGEPGPAGPASVVPTTGSPEGVITANAGEKVAIDATNHKIYAKESGVGDTGWALVLTYA